MAKHNNTGYQYETSPRKLQPEYKPIEKRYPKKSTVKKQKTSKSKNKVNKTKHVKMIMYVMISFAVLFVMSYRNAQVTENYSQIKALKSDLLVLQKENEQLKVNIESSLNLNNVEELATTLLGMNKLTNDQTVYVKFSRQDYIEPASEKVVIDTPGNWFSQIINNITAIIK